MLDGVNSTGTNTRMKALLATCGTILVLALSFGVWVYQAKPKRDLNRKLFDAVRNGDTETARLLLAQGANPNIRDMTEEQTNLWQQIKHAFHKDGQMPDDQMNNGNRTLLEMAVGLNAYDDQDGKHDPTKENAPMVKALLDAGARTEDSSFLHITPLMWAVSYNKLQTVQTLLDHGANPLAKDEMARIPIFFLSHTGTDELQIAELLVKLGNDVNAVEYEGETPLMSIIRGGNGNSKIVQFLIAKGADVNARSQFGYCALLDSTSMRKPELTRILLAHGAEVNVYDHDKNSPLQHAIENESFQEVEMLLAHGADVNYHNEAGDTALSLAKLRKDKQIVRLLKEAGAER